MKTIFGRFMVNQREIRDLKKQLDSIREENSKLKNLSSIEVNNKMTTKIIHLRNKVGLILKSIGNSFTLRSKRIEMLNKEIELLKMENRLLLFPPIHFKPFKYDINTYKNQDFSFLEKPLYKYPNNVNLKQSASYHSQGTVDRAQR